MSNVAEVISFARDYINNKSARTPGRKEKIRAALRELTGKKLLISCGTCYIEALYTILKLKNMAKYELRKGYVAQFFGDSSKNFTNKNLIENPAKYEPLAAEYLRIYPERAIFFVRRPGPLAQKPVSVVSEIKSDPIQEKVIENLESQKPHDPLQTKANALAELAEAERQIADFTEKEAKRMKESAPVEKKESTKKRPARKKTVKSQQ